MGDRITAEELAVRIKAKGYLYPSFEKGCDWTWGYNDAIISMAHSFECGFEAREKWLDGYEEGLRVSENLVKELTGEFFTPLA